MTGLYFDLTFVLMVITLISNTSVVTGEQIFKDIVNVVKFGELRKYAIINESAFISGTVSVSEILEDKYIPGNVLISTNHNVFTLDYVNRAASLIAGMVGVSAYIEGIGAGARFKHISGACQAGSDDEVIVVGQVSRCLRLINRTTNATRTFAGQCVGGTPTNAFQQTRFSNPINCIYSSVSQEIFMLDGNEVVKLLLAQGTSSRYPRLDSAVWFSALTLDFSSENIYLGSEDDDLYKFNITTNQFTAITSAANATTSGDGLLTQAKFQLAFTMEFVSNTTLLVGKGFGALKVIDLNDPPSVSSICEYNHDAMSFPDGDIRTCELASLTSLGYLPERSAVMVGLPGWLATLDVELVNTPGITAGSTVATRVNSTVNKPRTTAGNTLNTITNGPDSTAANTPRLTSANDGTTTTKEIDTTVVQAFSFGLRTHLSVITLTAMITALLIST